jgi:malonyl CoA-acyl carrier protein transacylase
VSLIINCLYLKEKKSFRQQVINQPNVKEMFNIAHRILGYDLYSKCINGPIEELNQTLYAQPAIYVTSLAAVQKLKSENQKVRNYTINMYIFAIFIVV